MRKNSTSPPASIVTPDRIAALNAFMLCFKINGVMNRCLCANPGNLRWIQRQPMQGNKRPGYFFHQCKNFEIPFITMLDGLHASQGGSSMPSLCRDAWATTVYWQSKLFPRLFYFIYSKGRSLAASVFPYR